MNDKFFELKKEKQDRMINGAMQVFAINGYKRASTDEMVKTVSVSKGLWFHYFESKLGLYEFVVDYVVKYMNMELAATVNPEERDYFTIFQQIENVKMAIRKQYPYAPLFLHSLLAEKDSEALTAVADFKAVYVDKLRKIYEQTDYSLFRDDVDMEPLMGTIHYTLDGILCEAYSDQDFNEVMYKRSTTEFLSMMRNLTYKEKAD